MRKLWAHQKEAIARAALLDHFGLFMDPGVGKTCTAVHIIRSKMNAEKRFLRTLIFCPPVILGQWRDEILANSKVDQNRVVLLKGSGAQRLKTFREHAKGSFIGVLNYESLLMGDLFKAMMDWGPEVIVWDESQKIKSPSAKRTKQAIKLSQGAKYKYLLTGTPILNSPLDLFSQFEALDNGETFGRNFFAFRARYMVDRNAGMPRDRYFPAWGIRPGALDEINRAISAKTITVKKEDALDLPDLVRKTVKVGLSPAQRRAYNEMRQDLIAFMGDAACVATMALTKALRLMQLSSGFAKLVDGSEVEFEDNPKMEALHDLLEEITPSHKVLVWCVFRQNYKQVRRVCERLGIEMVEITGEQTETQKKKAVDDFRSNEKIRVLCGHPQSGGVGLNLVEASYMIFYSRNFSLENDLQAEARCYRGGSEQHEKITRIDLVMENTIEELVSEKLASKQEVSFRILQDLKDRL